MASIFPISCTYTNRYKIYSIYVGSLHIKQDIRSQGSIGHSLQLVSIWQPFGTNQKVKPLFRIPFRLQPRSGLLLMSVHLLSNGKVSACNARGYACITGLRKQLDGKVRNRRFRVYMYVSTYTGLRKQLKAFAIKSKSKVSIACNACTFVFGALLAMLHHEVMPGM